MMNLDSHFSLQTDMVELYPRLFSIPFPQKNVIKEMGAKLGGQYGFYYMIWNISEYTYNNEKFDNQVREHCFRGYPNPPLKSIFIICHEVKNWLHSDINHIALIQCQGTMNRSALIIRCFLNIINVFNHPGEALTDFCSKIGKNEEDILFPSQRIYQAYFANIVDNISLNRKQVILEKVFLSSVPNVKNESLV